MAFRSSNSASASSGSITATPPGVQVGDYLGGRYLCDSASNTINYPAGWVERGHFTWAAGTPDGGQFGYADKIAAGGDSFTFSDTPNANSNSLVTGAWSDRDQASPRTATQTTQNTSSGASPVSATVTGLTAAAGDDIAIFLGGDQTTAAGRWTFSTIGAYTEQVDGVAQDWVSAVGLQTLDNTIAGATGDFSVTITNSGAGNIGYGAIVVAIKSGAAQNVLAWTQA